MDEEYISGEVGEMKQISRRQLIKAFATTIGIWILSKPGRVPANGKNIIPLFVDGKSVSIDCADGEWHRFDNVWIIYKNEAWHINCYPEERSATVLRVEPMDNISSVHVSTKHQAIHIKPIVF